MLTRSITIIYTIQWSSVGGSTRRDEGVVYVIIKRLLRVSNGGSHGQYGIEISWVPRVILTVQTSLYDVTPDPRRTMRSITRNKYNKHEHTRT